METRICRKCEIEKPIASFPRRYGRHAHLREQICGMCKKRAHQSRNPEHSRAAKRVETWRARARSMDLTLAEYVSWRGRKVEHRNRKRDRIKMRKNTRRFCPLVQVMRSRESSRAYYHRNIEKARNKVRRWAAANPAKRSAQHFRERVRRRAIVVADLTNDQWTGIKIAYRHRCAYCGCKPRKLTQDHVVPVSKGGQHTASNIVPACQSCNSSKGARMPRVSYQQHFLGSSPG